MALTGDGGLLMCVGELLTAAREALRIIVIVFDDASLSLIEIKQQARRLPAGRRRARAHRLAGARGQLRRDRHSARATSRARTGDRAGAHVRRAESDRRADRPIQLRRDASARFEERYEEESRDVTVSGDTMPESLILNGERTPGLRRPDLRGLRSIVGRHSGVGGQGDESGRRSRGGVSACRARVEGVGRDGARRARTDHAAHGADAS